MQPARKLTHAARVLRMREMFDAQDRVSVDELMGLFGVSRRTVYNDLRALEDAGVPIEPAPEGGAAWTLNVTARRRTLTMTVAQILSLGVARQALSFLQGTDLHAELGGVMARMSRGLSAHNRRFLDQLDRKITIVHLGAKSYAGQADALDDIVTCLLYEERIELSYRPPGKRMRTHVVEPLSLLVYAEALYLVGMSRTRGERRIFAVDRIAGARRLRGDRFAYPERFDPQQLFDGAFGITLGDEAPQQVELLFDADQAPYVRERRWHPSQVFEQAPDGRTRMRMRVRESFELIRWVLGRAQSVEVAAPASLRGRIGDILGRAARRNRTASGT